MRGRERNTRSWWRNAADRCGMRGAFPLELEEGALQKSHSVWPTASWASPEHASEKPSMQHLRLQRKPHHGCGSGGTGVGRQLLGHRPGTDQSRSGRLGALGASLRSDCPLGEVDVVWFSLCFCKWPLVKCSGHLFC